MPPSASLGAGHTAVLAAEIFWQLPAWVASRRRRGDVTLGLWFLRSPEGRRVAGLACSDSTITWRGVGSARREPRTETRSRVNIQTCTDRPWGFLSSRAARGLVISFGVIALQTGLCVEAVADRPAAVDHSTEMYFPPIGGPQEIGDCTCWSSCYYYSTYMQARDEGLDASTGDPDVICSPRFLFVLIAQGWWGAECTEHAMARLADVGCAPVSRHPMSAWYTDWPTTSAWVAALDNRPGPLESIRADTAAGLEAIKQRIADGGVVVTRADFLSNYGDYGSSARGPGIDNRVMYRRQGWHYLRHSICVVGYDDDRPYVDDRDGQTHQGAFLIANSEGPNWGWHNSTETGSRGFIWVAYTMFLESEIGWYDYELEVSPCFDNAPYPEVYFHEDRPHYRPRLYAVAGINHSDRNLLTFSGGIGPPETPEFSGPNAIEPTDAGDISINHSRRPAVDLTDGIHLIPPGATRNVFISLGLESSATSAATITSVYFHHDFDGDGTCTVVSAEIESPVVVWPGTTEYVSVSLTNPLPGDLDGDGAVDLSDLAQLLSSYGLASGAQPEDGDLDGDGDVDLSDLAGLLANYGVGV